MAKYESDLVRVAPAEFDQRLRHKNESPRQSECVRLSAFDRFKTESARLVDHASGQTATDFIQHPTGLGVRHRTQLAPYFARQILTDLVFDLDGVGFAAGYGLPHPPAQISRSPSQIR
jgi:hypothetical protein